MPLIKAPFHAQIRPSPGATQGASGRVIKASWRARKESTMRRRLEWWIRVAHKNKPPTYPWDIAYSRSIKKESAGSFSATKVLRQMRVARTMRWPLKLSNDFWKCSIIHVTCYIHWLIRVSESFELSSNDDAKFPHPLFLLLLFELKYQ